ncbi:MAG: alkaline phosphatase family protein [Puia sp.]|nr:alkaline phosphatase family protein [Puia sp.]
MKRYLFLCLLITGYSHLEAQHRAKKVIFIIADGIPADMIEKAKPPVINAIAKTGGYKRAHVGGERGGYSQTPTISAVGYNSLLTGVWANKHNVWGNDIKDPDYNYPSLFRLLKEAYPDKKTAIFSTWQDNRTRLVGDSLPQTGNFAIDYHADGFELDTLGYPHDPKSGYIHAIDEKVTGLAADCIRNQAPDLTWLYLEYTDDMGHRYGDGPQMNEAIGYMDRQVGKIWNEIQYRQQHFAEDWLIVITTDHGRDSVTGRNHGGQSDRERTTWIVTNAHGLNSYWKDSEPAIVDILPTITRFMDIPLPRENLMELDGVALIGKVSVTEPAVRLAEGKFDIHWKPVDKDGHLKIWVSTTNHYKEGGKDSYKLLGEVPVSQRSAIFGAGSDSSAFYKIVLEAPDNTVNRWIPVK